MRHHLIAAIAAPVRICSTGRREDHGTRLGTAPDRDGKFIDVVQGFDDLSHHTEAG